MNRREKRIRKRFPTKANSTVEEHKSGKVRNARRVKYSTAIKPTKPANKSINPVALATAVGVGVAAKNAKKTKTTKKVEPTKKVEKTEPTKKVEPIKTPEPAKDTEPPLAFGRRVEIKSHRTRAEYLSQAREGFINQFMDRLNERFPNAPQDEVAEIKNWLLAHDYVSISRLLKHLDDEYQEMYYESSSREYKEGKSMEDFINDFLNAANEYDGEIDEDFE